MIFNYKKIEKYDYEKISNFFHTFGCFVLNDAVNAEQKIKFIQFSKEIIKNRKNIDLDKISQSISILEPSIFEDFPDVQTLFLQKKITDLLENILGKKWLYLGSDFNIFSSDRTHPWHRDWRINMPILKIGYYIKDDLAKDGGQLRIIPGSQRIGDSYSSLIQRGLDLPSHLKNPGGLNENEYFPYNEIYNLPIKPDFELCKIPHAAINISNPNQFVIFDLRAVHTGTITLPKTRRIMFSSIFAPNPFDETFDIEKYGIKISREELAQQLAEILIIDRCFYKSNKTYHKLGIKPNLSDEHLLELSIEKNNYKISFCNKKDIKYNFANIKSKYENKGDFPSDEWLLDYLRHRSEELFKI